MIFSYHEVDMSESTTGIKQFKHYAKNKLFFLLLIMFESS